LVLHGHEPESQPLRQSREGRQARFAEVAETGDSCGNQEKVERPRWKPPLSTARKEVTEPSLCVIVSCKMQSQVMCLCAQ
jgi:hypothetical protein